MKRIIPLAAFAAISLVSCQKELVSRMPEQTPATLTLRILSEDVSAATKAVSAYTDAQTYESKVNSVQVLVFGDDGYIHAYKDAGTALSDIQISTTAGEKTIYALVNGPSMANCKTLQELETTVLELGTYNSTESSKGFVMSGSTTKTLTAAGTEASLKVSRLTARIALKKVTNKLPAGYGSLKIENVLLTNVVGDQNVKGDASPSIWYNKMGRKDENSMNSTHIIDGSSYTASCPTLTWKNVAQTVSNGSSHAPGTPYLFYSYANASTSEDSGFTNPFTARRSRLVISATVNNTLYYYPVTIESLARNKAYTVEVTITGLGSTDPDAPVVKGTITSSVSVAGWDSGATYDETI